MAEPRPVIDLADVPTLDDGGSMEPVWRRIADLCQQCIVDEHWPRGSRLPTEAEFARHFAVNRHTVRKAIEVLARDDLIITQAGKGSFVTSGKPLVLPLSRHGGLCDYAALQRLPVATLLLGHQIAEAGAYRADRLQIEANVGLVTLTVRHALAGTPCSIEMVSVPHARFPGFIDAFRRSYRLFEALGGYGLADLEPTSSLIGARLASRRELQLLSLKADAVLLTQDTVYRDASGAPAALVEARHAVDRVRLTAAHDGKAELPTAST